jgi:hypothetical protein
VSRVPRQRGLAICSPEYIILIIRITCDLEMHGCKRSKVVKGVSRDAWERREEQPASLLPCCARRSEGFLRGVLSV